MTNSCTFTGTICLLYNFKFQVPRSEEVDFYIDAYNLKTSNWSRWVNCARTSETENVEWFYCAGRVYYLTTKDIFPGQELLMYYGHDIIYMLAADERINTVQPWRWDVRWILMDTLHGFHLKYIHIDIFIPCLFHTKMWYICWNVRIHSFLPTI